MFNFNKQKNISFSMVNGFSMIEVMVAIMIIGVAFIGLVQIFPTALNIIKSAENNTRASYYAQEKIEEIYQYGYDSIASGTIEVRHVLGSSGSVRNAFQRETEVNCIDSNLNAIGADQGLKKITTRVYFINSSTKNEEIFELSTIISRRQ